MQITVAIEQSVGTALGREVGYDESISLVGTGHPSACRVVVDDDAAGRLGRLLGAIANLTVPQRIVLSGEGVRLVKVARSASNEGIDETPGPRVSVIDVATIIAESMD